MVDSTCKPWKATSNGAWAGDNPVHFSLPLLTVQLCLILFFSRLFAFLMKPLRQPRVIAEIAGGIVLGSSAFGYIPNFTDHIFPKASLTVLTTVANLGLLFFLFMVGLELDVRSLKKTGRAALVIALVGIGAPFGLGAAASFAIRHILEVKSDFPPFVVFIGVAMSITAFPVLARILAERKLLTTDVGQMAMSAAAVNDVLAWVLLALAVALSGSDTSSLVVAWILLCGLAFILVMFIIVGPFMAFLCKHVEENEPVPEWIVAITFTLVMLSGFTTDAIGIHGIFGAFVFGLVIPKDGPFASLIIDKIEDFTTIILLPLYFASSGLNVNLQSINDSKSAGVVFLVIGVACVGKIGGTVIAALLNDLPFRKSLALGILMNTKGLVELIVLNIGLQKQVINQELYTIMVIMALVTTFMTTPLLMWLYEPAKDKVPYLQTKLEDSKDGNMRLLVCVHGTRSIPGMLNLVEIVRGSRKKPLAGFLLHLVEFSERSSAVLLVTKFRKDGRPFVSKEAEREGRDQVAVAFQAYARLSRVQMEAMTAISGFSNMHEDVCRAAQDKRANFIILPYHKHLTLDGKLQAGLVGYQTVNQQVFRTAPCSVGVLVDRGLGSFAQTSPEKVAFRVAVLFFGGPDDREALSLGLRMAEHPGIHLTVVNFTPKDPAELALALAESANAPPRNWSMASLEEGGLEVSRAPSKSSFIITTDKLLIDSEANLDMAALALAKSAATKEVESGEKKGTVVFDEREVEEASAAALAVGKEEFDLLIVGRGRRPAPLVALLAHSHVQHRGRFREDTQRLGPIGDELVVQEIYESSGTEGEEVLKEGRLPSLLVVQQHDPQLVKTGKQDGH